MKKTRRLASAFDQRDPHPTAEEFAQRVAVAKSVRRFRWEFNKDYRIRNS